MEIAIQTEQTSAGVPVVHVHGEIYLHTCPALRTALDPLLEKDYRDIVLELAEVPYIDSAGLGVLLDAARRVRVHLVGTTAFVRRSFEITRLNMLFVEHDTLAEALEDIQKHNLSNRDVKGSAAA